MNKSNDLSANSGSLAGFQVLLSTNLTKNLIESSSYRSCSIRFVTDSLSEIQRKVLKPEWRDVTTELIYLHLLTGTGFPA